MIFRRAGFLNLLQSFLKILYHFESDRMLSIEHHLIVNPHMLPDDLNHTLIEAIRNMQVRTAFAVRCQYRIDVLEQVPHLLRRLLLQNALELLKDGPAFLRDVRCNVLQFVFMEEDLLADGDFFGFDRRIQEGIVRGLDHFTLVSLLAEQGRVLRTTIFRIQVRDTAAVVVLGSERLTDLDVDVLGLHYPAPRRLLCGVNILVEQLILRNRGAVGALVPCLGALLFQLLLRVVGVLEFFVVLVGPRDLCVGTDCLRREDIVVLVSLVLALYVVVELSFFEVGTGIASGLLLLELAL